MLADAVAAEDLEPALALPDLFPEVGGAVATGGIPRIAGAAVVALVEGQEGGSLPFEPGRHVDLGVAHREMDEGAAGEGQERLDRPALRFRVAVVAVLVDRVADALGEVRLQLRRRHGQAVEEEDEIEAVLVVERIAHLPDHAEAVGLVARQDLLVEGEGGPELGHRECLAQTHHIDAVAEHVEGAALVELGADPIQQGCLGG
jgi:hypothetical protein